MGDTERGRIRQTVPVLFSLSPYLPLSVSPSLPISPSASGGCPCLNAAKRQQLRPRHHNANYPIVSVPQLSITRLQKREHFWIGVLLQIALHEFGHLLVVSIFRVRVNGIAAGVASKIAVERRAHVIKLVENRDQFLLEALVEKPRQAEREQIEHLAIVHEVTLYLILDVTMSAGECPFAEAEGGYAGLKTVTAAVATRGKRHEHSRHVDVPKRLAAIGYIVTEKPHCR